MPSYNTLFVLMQTLVMVIFALIVGGIYFQLATTPSGMMDRYIYPPPLTHTHTHTHTLHTRDRHTHTHTHTHRLGVIFFIVMSQVFGNLGAIELFIKERAAFL